MRGAEVIKRSGLGKGVRKCFPGRNVTRIKQHVRAYVVPVDDPEADPVDVSLWAAITGEGAGGAPVVTIGAPEDW